MTRKLNRVAAKDYGDDEINKMALLHQIFDDMTAPQIQRTMWWLRERYAEELARDLGETT